MRHIIPLESSHGHNLPLLNKNIPYYLLKSELHGYIAKVWTCLIERAHFITYEPPRTANLRQKENKIPPLGLSSNCNHWGTWLNSQVWAACQDEVWYSGGEGWREGSLSQFSEAADWFLDQKKLEYKIHSSPEQTLIDYEPWITKP